MDEEARIILYNQLLKFQKNSKIKGEKLIEWENFLKLSNKDTLEYVLGYRDEILARLIKEQQEINKNDYYIELPEMNLEGENLSNVYLHTFMAGYSKERNNGKKIFITTAINLKDTGCIINLATIRPIIVSEDGINIKEIIADIKKCDFRGCIVFGKFQNSKAKLDYTDDNLPENYIKRLTEYEVPYNARLTTDIVYMDMLEGKIVKGTNGLENVKQMVDYDLTPMNREIWKYRDIIKSYKINIDYTGAFINEYGFESIGKENYYIDLEARAKEAYKNRNFKFIEEKYEELDKETKSRILALALRDGEMKFVKGHKKELTSLQKKYLNIQNKGKLKKEETQMIKDELMREYKEKDFMNFDIDFMNSSEEIKQDIIKAIYELGDLTIVERYLNNVDVKCRNEIFMEENKKGNEEFLYRNFSSLEIPELKSKIMAREWENKNIDFLCDNYDAISNEEMKNKILKLAFDAGKVRFIEKHFDSYPKNMQMEAAIKFNDIKLPQDVMMRLMK